MNLWILQCHNLYAVDVPFAESVSRAVSPTPGSNLIAAARNAYGKIISGLQTEFTGRVLGEEAWHERYSGFRGELIGLLGLGLQKWLAKGAAVGLTYVSSQVSDSRLFLQLILFIGVVPLTKWVPHVVELGWLLCLVNPPMPDRSNGSGQR